MNKMETDLEYYKEPRAFPSIDAMLQDYYSERMQNSVFAKKFKEDLISLGKAQRMVKGLGKRKGFYLILYFQARVIDNVVWARYVAGGSTRPDIKFEVDENG